MAEPRGHHFVAQLYQRGFARETRPGQWQAVVFDRRTGDRHLSNIRDIFKQRDWNAIVDDEGNRDHAIEEFLADHIEAPAAPGIDALREGRLPVPLDHRRAIAVFMAAQLTRGRQVRAALAEFVSSTQHQMLSLAAQHYSDEKWQEITGETMTLRMREQMLESEKHFEIRPSNALLLQTLLSTVDDVAGMLEKRTWTLVRFEEPCLFTSEHPVIHFKEGPNPMPYGVATADQINFPLSTTFALLLSHPWTGWPEAPVRGTLELAKKLNGAMYFFPSCDEMLLHPDIESYPIGLQA